MLCIVACTEHDHIFHTEKYIQTLGMSVKMLHAGSDWRTCKCQVHTANTTLFAQSSCISWCSNGSLRLYTTLNLIASAMNKIATACIGFHVQMMVRLIRSYRQHAGIMLLLAGQSRIGCCAY